MGSQGSFSSVRSKHQIVIPCRFNIWGFRLPITLAYIPTIFGYTRQALSIKLKKSFWPSSTMQAEFVAGYALNPIGLVV